MAYEKPVPVWNAEGAEPPETLKNTGFQAGYKPPADYFNWFWHAVSECLKELQEKAGDIDAAPAEHEHDAADITSGTFDAARIPNLNASKIASGVFAADRIPSLAASKITAGTFASTSVVAMTGTDYETQRIRNASASTTDLTAGTSALGNSNMRLVYE